MLLTACTSYKQTAIKIEKVKVEVPEELLEVETLPQVPKDASKQSEVSIYLIDLWNSANSCNQKLSDIKQHIKSF